MRLQEILTAKVQHAVQSIFGIDIEKVEFQATRRDFEGDITVVIFPLLKVVKGNPVQIGSAIGEYLKENSQEVEGFNVVSGFLNISIADDYYLNYFNQIKDNQNFGFEKQGEAAVMVEFASPNTNKPLHLGHVRNVLLGYSVAQILEASGKKVYKTQVINDRGIHICKSMLAWQKFGNGETPASTGLKGDKLVGNYYVAFDKEYKTQIQALMAQNRTEEQAKKEAPIILEAQQMLLDWEAGKPEVMELWKTMNAWVYDGFEVTYKNIGVDFDCNYYESDTYLLGKDVVESGLESGTFFKKEDGSVWIDLTEDGLDEKLVLRSDGTSVYMTQDIGTAIQRVKDYPDVNGMVYTVGNEQDYHFKVLFLILKKLGYSWAENLFHLSYGMVDLPSGKMKSREGTVVDADELIADMETTAREISEELGKLDGYSEEDKDKLYKIIGLGALKYYILKVDPKKRILFDPKESVDFTGNTGPFIQYTYARIQSIIRKADFDFSSEISNYAIADKEKEIIKQLAMFPEIIQNAAHAYSPALIANYTYDLVREYNSFYQSTPILATEDRTDKAFRVQLSKKVGDTIKAAFSLLGIDVPERM
ncbi:MAG TPA: arginine--tRNA ligase [Flavobacterium sp.]|nr:arginine--tRNA ligase [Flavobacterium sp.]